MDALNFAAEKLRTISPLDIAKNSGSQWNQQEKTLIVPYLNKYCRIKIPDFYFSEETKLNNKEKVLILHYLARSKDISETGNLISFSELEAGNIYKPSIEARVYKPLIDKFGSSGGEFLNKVKLLGAIKTEISEFSIRIQIFPKVSIYIVVYPADEEFPASCQILFDSSIKQFLDTEDIVVMCEEITEKLISL